MKSKHVDNDAIMKIIDILCIHLFHINHRCNRKNLLDVLILVEYHQQILYF